MARRNVILTKTRTQKFEVIIVHDKDDPDEMADMAWKKFNQVQPDVITEYTTEVSKITQ